MKFIGYARKCMLKWGKVVKPSTLALYEYRIHALSFLDTDMEEINNKRLQEIADILSERYSRNSVSDFIVFIRMVIRDAIKNGEINNFVFDRIRIRVQKKRKERVCLSDAEFDKLSDYCMNNPLQRGSVACMLGLYAGLRIGEISALRWSDVSFTRRTIHVQRTRQRIYDYSGKSTIHDGSPKSSTSDRIIPISERLKVVLESKKNSCNNSDYVASFLKNGTEPRQLRVHIDKLLSKAGIERINPHALRHSFISRAINGGANIKAVSELAGHADAKITLDIYTHANEKSKIFAIEALDK